MLNALGELAWKAVPIVLVAIPLISVWRRSPVPSEMRFLSGLFYAAALALALFIFGFAVLFRDGLGPGSVPSHGLTALARTAEGLTPLALCIPLALLGHWFGRARAPGRQRSGHLW
jgi:hypothetical protein